MSLDFNRLSTFLIGMSVSIAGLEWIILSFDRFLTVLFDSNSLILKLQDRGMKITHVPSKRFENLRLARWLSFGMLVAGLFLIGMAISNHYIPVIYLSALIIFVIFNTLCGLGLEGSDQMVTIVLFALTMRNIYLPSEHILQFFVMVQLQLSYVVSGIAKSVSKDWRQGYALIMVISTHSFGLGNTNSFFLKNKWPQLICFSVILFEISWLLLPFNIYFAIILMAIGLLFHLVNSLIMGLNLFSWSFCAAYPWAFAIVLLLNK